MRFVPGALEDKLEVVVGEMTLQVATVHVVGQSDSRTTRCFFYIILDEQPGHVGQSCLLSRPSQSVKT